MTIYDKNDTTITRIDGDIKYYTTCCKVHNTEINSATLADAKKMAQNKKSFCACCGDSNFIFHDFEFIKGQKLFGKHMKNIYTARCKKCAKSNEYFGDPDNSSYALCNNMLAAFKVSCK